MKKRYLFFALLTFFLVHNNVLAFGMPQEDHTGDYTDVNLGVIGTGSGGEKYSCKYKYKISISGDVTTDIYDRNNKLINPNTLVPSEETPAGTAVGINIYEIKTVRWDVKDIEVTKKNPVTYTCRKYTSNCSSSTTNNLIASIRTLRPIVDDTGICSGYWSYLYNQTSCPSGYSEYGTNGGDEEAVTSGEYYNKCRDLGEEKTRKKATKTLYPSYNIKLQDPNDVNGNKITTISSSPCKTSGEKVSSCRFTYSVAKVCLNVKTAIARYITNNSSNCNKDEIEVKNDSNHWHYFIPLNAKSKTDYSLVLSTTGGDTKYSANACRNYINSNPDYVDLIVTGDKKEFTGNKSKDLALANNGCYMASKIRIPVKQEFYNEKDDKLVGYSFYYQPIDINNPFPNGVGKDSYWLDWYNSKNKNPDLTKSFAKVTYYTGTINATNIRNYNRAHKYTSWDNMNLSGLSSYITDSMRINVDKKTIYKLGCGPYNKDWSECKK